MTIKYKHSYLTDGTKVKITEQLFNQLIKWENEGYEFHFHYIDLLKMQDNDAINKDRVFYAHNTSLDEELKRKNSSIMFLHDIRFSIEKNLINNERETFLAQILNQCTETQRRRFIKHYYLNYNYSEIAIQEHCSRTPIVNSIKAVEKILINYEQLIYREYD